MLQNRYTGFLWQVVRGILVLSLLQFFGWIGLFLLATLISRAPVAYSSHQGLILLFGGAINFTYWQFLYVTPLAFWTVRRRNSGMTLGVTVGVAASIVLHHHFLPSAG